MFYLAMLMMIDSCPEQCVAPAVQRAVPKGSPQAYFALADYPRAAMANREQGVAMVELAINSDGRVGGCKVGSGSGSAQLDQTTCRLLRSRARFVPARDANNQPTSDQFQTSIEWKLPSN